MEYNEYLVVFENGMSLTVYAKDMQYLRTQNGCSLLFHDRREDTNIEFINSTKVLYVKKN